MSSVALDGAAVRPHAAGPVLDGVTIILTLSILLLGTVPTTTKLVGVALALVAAVFLAIEPAPAPAPDVAAPQAKTLKEYGRS